MREGMSNQRHDEKSTLVHWGGGGEGREREREGERERERERE